MASMRDIKRRKSSISSTQQITKAMKLVSTVKLQKARTRAEHTAPYSEYMYRTLCSILARSGMINHPYLRAGDSPRKAVIVITSNRGLAGGYNSNVVKLVTGSGMNKDDLDIYSIGAKGTELLTRRGYHIVLDSPEVIESPTYADASVLCEKLLNAYTNGEVGEIYLAYTYFKNTVSHEPRLVKLLPLGIEDETGDGLGSATGTDSSSGISGSSSAAVGSRMTSDAAAGNDAEVSASNSAGSSSQTGSGAIAVMNYEPSEEEALDEIIPKYVTSLIHGALIEAVASENGARMQAMDSATSNAEEMIDDLTLKYNRARQGAITQELTEIIAGANAIA